MRTRARPVAHHVGDLPCRQPCIGGHHGMVRRRAALGHSVPSQCRIPDRRQAGLAIGAVALDHQQLAHRRPGGRGVRMLRRIAEAVEHHHGIGHGRINAAQPVLAVQPLGHERHRGALGAPAQIFREQRLHHPQAGVDVLENPTPGRAIGAADPVAHLLRRCAEQFSDVNTARISGARAARHQHQQRHQHRARPV